MTMTTTTTRIHAAVVRGPGQIECSEIELAEPGPGEVLIDIEACGICGSDLHMLAGDGVPVGHTPGHEMCGRVRRLGPNVDGIAEGARVVVEPTIGCGHCSDCASGNPQRCRDLEIYGVHKAGGLAEKMLVRADCLHRVDDALAPEVASLAEPFAVAVHGLRRAGIQRGERVLVQGAGTIGLVTTLVATAMGAEVWQSARYEHQGRRARALGATVILREDEADARSLAKLARQTDFDVVAETVGGHASTLSEASYAVRPGGTILVLGMFLESPKIEPLSLLMKEATMVWSNCYAKSPGRRKADDDFAYAVRLLEEHREAAASLATHRFKLSEVDAAFAAAADRREGTVKISIVP